MNILNKFKNLIFKYKLLSTDSWHKAQIYSQYLGVKFGTNVRITGDVSFSSEPYLIEIGNDVTITRNVVFHTHDGGVGLFRNEFPGINIFGKIIVGNNVFIGSDSIIMPGIKIGNNVVIGAGSVVTKDIPDDVVVSGVPAKILHTLVDYKKKCLERAVYISETDPIKRRKQILRIMS